MTRTSRDRVVGAAIATAVSLAIAALGAIVPWHGSVGWFSLRFDPWLGLVGAIPAAVSAAGVAPTLVRATSRGLLMGAARMVAMTVAISIAAILVLALVSLATGWPPSDLRGSTGGLVLMLAAVVGYALFWPVFSIALFPLAVLWSALTRFVIGRTSPVPDLGVRSVATE